MDYVLYWIALVLIAEFVSFMIFLAIPPHSLWYEVGGQRSEVIQVPFPIIFLRAGTRARCFWCNSMHRLAGAMFLDSF